MAITIINVGLAANDGTGDPLRTAMQAVNANFALVPEKAAVETISGAWTMSDALITGGAINGVIIGSVTPAAADFTIGLFGAGTAAAPSISFTADNNTGFFQDTPNVIGVTVAGVKKFEFGATNVGIVLLNSANAPQINNKGATNLIPTILPSRADQNSGLGWAGADLPSFIAGGVEVLRGNISGQGMFTAGTAALPSMSFILDPNTGIFNSAANEMQFSLNGVSKFRMVFDTFRGTLTSSAALLNIVATGTIPNILPDNQDPDTGIGHVSANVLSIIVGGSQAIRISTSSIQMNESTLFLNGSAANPSISFIADIDTGFMRDGTANVFSIVNGGVEKIQFHPDLTGMHFIAGTNTPAIRNENATATNPNFTPSRADPDTGIGWTSANIFNLIAGGVNAQTITSASMTLNLPTTAAADPTVALGLATKQYVDAQAGGSGGFSATLTKTTNYTAVAGDAGSLFLMNSAGGLNFTINDNVFAPGDVITVLQKGAGAVTINGTATLNTQGTKTLVTDGIESIVAITIHIGGGVTIATVTGELAI